MEAGELLSQAGLGDRREDARVEYQGLGYRRRGIETAGSHEFGCGHAGCHDAEALSRWCL